MSQQQRDLAEWEGCRGTFTGVFVRWGEERRDIGRGFSPLVLGETVLLRNVCDQVGKVVTEHAWLHRTRQWETLDLRAGDMVQFRARVRAYYKGYEGLADVPLKRDYELVDLRRIVVIRSEGEPDGRFRECGSRHGGQAASR
jgi:hypothetical protein